MALRETLYKLFTVCSNLNSKSNVRGYLTVLSADDDENLALFSRFAGESSSTLLSILYELGYFANEVRLLNLVREILEMRDAFGHEEEDAGGHIASCLQGIRRNTELRGNRGK